MSILNNSDRRISFLGQNSHGSHESWTYRQKYVARKRNNSSMAVVFECPTTDLILFSLKRKEMDEDRMKAYFSTSSYWWMRTNEFRNFICSLPMGTAVYGIDVPFALARHPRFIDALAEYDFPEKAPLQDLLRVDLAWGYNISTITPEGREALLAEKLSRLLNVGYREVIVICHNFHATRHSWLPYPSLCQQIIEKLGNRYLINSVGVFSKRMTFLATPDGQSLDIFELDDGCLQQNNNYQVKMVSSFFRTEEQDALSLILRVPVDYDEVIVYETGNPITLENMNG